MNQFDDDMQGGEVESVEIPDAAFDDGDIGGGGKKGGNKMILAIVIAVLLPIQAVTSHLIVKKMFFANPPQASARPRPEREDRQQMGQVYAVEGLIINPQGSRGNRHLLLDLGFESGSDKVITELQTLDPVLRDNIITFLGSQTPSTLTDIEWRERIRDRLVEIANYHLTEGQVDNVYFVRYVFQ